MKYRILAGLYAVSAAASFFTSGLWAAMDRLPLAASFALTGVAWGAIAAFYCRFAPEGGR